MLSRYFLSLFAPLVFFGLTITAQSDFTVFGDSESFEQGFGVHMGQDDLLRLLGFGNADEIGGVDLQLSTFDLSNNLLSTVTFGSTEDDFGKRSTQHSDGFRISGFSGTGDVRATLWKVSPDASSYEEWTYDRPGTVEVFNDHLEMPDGSWIAAGYLKNGAISDPLIVAFSSAGDTLWSRRFVTPEIDYWMGVERTDAGELLLVGDRFQDAIGGYDVFFTRLAADGSFIEEHELGGPGNNGSRHIAPTTDGKFIVTGEGAPALGEAFDIMLIEAEPTGVPNWTRFYGGEGGDAGFDLIQVDDNTIAISGYETTGLMVEFCLLITDRAGNQDTLIRRGQDLVDIGQAIGHNGIEVYVAGNAFDDDPQYALLRYPLAQWNGIGEPQRDKVSGVQTVRSGQRISDEHGIWTDEFGRQIGIGPTVPDWTGGFLWYLVPGQRARRFLIEEF